MTDYLYFVAFYKHGHPQHLIAGPFIDENAARLYIANGKSENRCVVQTLLTFEETYDTPTE